jgi:hypothetical protein
MLDNKAQGLRQASPNRCTWNVAGLGEFAQGGERGLIKGFENCVVDNIGRRVRMPLFGLSRPARPETREGDRSPLSRRLHRGRGAAQVPHELRGLKIHFCWDRGKLCIDPLCPTLSFNVKFDFSHKEITSPRCQNQIRRFCLSETCSYSVGYKMLLLDSQPGEQQGWC